MVIVASHLHKLRLIQVVEVGVLKSHPARDSLIGFQSNHLLKEVDGRLIHILHMLTHWYASPLWETGFKIVVFQSFWPVMLIRGTLNGKNFEDLVDFGVSDKKSFPLSHLSENATYAPNINWGRILLGA